MYVRMYVHRCVCEMVRNVCMYRQIDGWMDKWLYCVRLKMQKYHLYEAHLTCSSWTIVFGGNNYPLTIYFVLMM